MTAEAESEGTRPHARECQEPPELGEAGRTFPRASRGRAALPATGFQNSGLQTEKTHVHGLRPLFVVVCVAWPGHHPALRSLCPGPDADPEELGGAGHSSAVSWVPLRASASLPSELSPQVWSHGEKEGQGPFRSRHDSPITPVTTGSGSFPGQADARSEAVLPTAEQLGEGLPRRPHTVCLGFHLQGFIFTTKGSRTGWKTSLGSRRC